MRASLKFLTVLTFTVPTVLITLILVVTSLVFLPYQGLVQLIARTCRPDLVSMVRGASNVMFFGKIGPWPSANISAYLVVAKAGAISVEEVRNRVQTCLLSETTESGALVYAKLKQVVTSFMGYRFFKFVESFDLREYVRPFDHARELALPRNDLLTESHLKKLCGKLISKPWPAGRSNWEILVADNFKSDDSDELKTLIFFRMSHGYADGFCFQRFITKIADGSPEPQKFQRQRQISWKQLALQMIALPLKVVWDTALEMSNLMSDRNRWILGLNQPEPRELMSTFTKQYPVEVIKEIKTEFKVPYTAILFTALSTAIYKLMKEGGCGEKIPKKILCVIPFPKSNHPGGLTNHFVGGVMVVPIFERSTALNIKLMSTHFQSAVRSTAPILTHFWLNMLGTVPHPLVRVSYLIVATSMGVSLMPVVTEPVTYGGAELNGSINVIAGINLPARQGVYVSMGGSNGMQRISVLLDTTVFQNPKTADYLGRLMEQEIDNMYEMVKGQRECAV